MSMGTHSKDRGEDFDDQYAESRKNAEKNGVPALPDPPKTGGGRKPDGTTTGNPRGQRRS